MDIVLEGFKEALRLIVTLDNEVFEVVILSLKVSLISLAVAVLLSLPLGIIIARYEFFGKRMLLRLIYTLMGMPPVLCGLFVYILFMRRGSLGSLRLNYTVTAMVIAQIFLMIPILTGLTINAARERQEQITMLAKDLNLTHLLDKRAGETSLGEAQKAALARALSFEPKLLLLDEPCASIDLQTTAEIERMLKKINREQKTTIFIVTHNLVQARKLSDYVVMMDHGKVVEWGENPEFFEHPKMPETRRLIEGEVLI